SAAVGDIPVGEASRFDIPEGRLFRWTDRAVGAAAPPEPGGPVDGAALSGRPPAWSWRCRPPAECLGSAGPFRRQAQDPRWASAHPGGWIVRGAPLTPDGEGRAVIAQP